MQQSCSSHSILEKEREREREREREIEREREREEQVVIPSRPTSSH
jgi:hypothetical protein